MKRSKPMKRSGFKRQAIERVRTMPQRSSVAPSACRMWDGKATLTVAVPKRDPVVSKTLREAYRLLPCQFDGPDGGICGRQDGTVCCCHSNQLKDGKGMGQKADDTKAAAGCSTCHSDLDQGSKWSKQERRERFDRAAARSRALLMSMGLWPESEPAALQATTED